MLAHSASQVILVLARKEGSTVKHRMASYFWGLALAAILSGVSNAAAQTVAYRQADLSSDVPQLANSLTPTLQNPWGIAFQAGQAFFIANQKAEFVTAHQPDGTGLVKFRVEDHPTAIVAAPSGEFTFQGFSIQYVVVSEEGIVFAWGLDPQGDFSQQALPVRDNSANGAVYAGAAIVNPACCATFLAVANFHSGEIEAYTQLFDRLVPAGSLTDPNLPPGYAPFGMQVIGNQVFVTYAVQDAAKQSPVSGAGNGMVNVFDLEGNFVRRFATGGELNAPWGVTQAGANFGPFSNDILIGNSGDGTISAFDPATGNFVGQLRDGDGTIIRNAGLHALAFRSDGFADPNTLYFAAGIGDGLDGLLGALTTGLVSITRVSAPATPANDPGPGNSGSPTGTVTIQDGSTILETVPLVNGVATVDAVLAGVRIHNITASYSGDTTFLASASTAQVQVTGPATMTTLMAPANASSDSAVVLKATATTEGSIPIGNVQFLDSFSGVSHIIGEAALDASGIATLTVKLVGLGAHALIARFQGNGNLAASESAAVTITVSDGVSTPTGGDFSLTATPTSATVIAGQSVQVLLTAMPAGGFASDIAFSCSSTTGIACAFAPAVVNTTNGAASTTLTVTTSPSVPHYGQMLSVAGLGLLLTGLALLGTAIVPKKKRRRTPGAFVRAFASALMGCVLSLAAVGCSGYNTSAQANHSTASVTVMAQSGSVSHVAAINLTVQ